MLLTTLFIFALPNWSTTFATEPVATHLQGSALRVVVVTAGSESADSKEASQALEAALKATKKARVVVSSASLGKFTAMDDEAIVKKCAKLPLDVVITVRAFDGDEGATVIVTLYDKAGEVLSAFSAEKGRKIAARSEDAPLEVSKASRTVKKVIGEPVAKASTEASETSGGLEAPQEIGNDAYDTKYIGFEQWVGINRYGAVVSTWSTPYQGKYHRELSNAEFYEIVERPDLAEKYRAKNRVRLGLGLGLGLGGVVAGATMVGVGTAMALGSSSGGGCRVYGIPTTINPYPGCLEYAPTSGGIGVGLLISGSVLSLAGIVGGMVAMFMNPHPVKPHEALALADSYNKKLRKKANGELEEEKPSPDKTAKLSWEIAPSFSGSGGGVVVGGTF
jgi:hypothetical protein